MSIAGPIHLAATKIDDIDLKKLVEYGTLKESEAELLKKAIVDKKNILVCGTTGSGKTTLTRALMRSIPESARVFYIDPYRELRSVQNRMELKKQVVNGSRQLDYLILPDHLLANDVYEKVELDLCIDMMKAGSGVIFNTHSDRHGDALLRLSMIHREQIGSTIDIKEFNRILGDNLDLIVVTERATDGIRKVSVFKSVRYDEDGDRFIINK